MGRLAPLVLLTLLSPVALAHAEPAFDPAAITPFLATGPGA